MIFRKLEVTRRSQLIALMRSEIVRGLLCLRSALMTVHAIDLGKQFALQLGDEIAHCYRIALFVRRLRSG